MSQIDRIADRDCCKIAAEIAVPGDQGVLPCLISNISEGGACLELNDSTPLPSNFAVLVPVMDDLVERRSVELRWQNGRTLGVRFKQD